MKVKLVCLEDGITSCGFRKMAAWVDRLHADTEACYVSTDNYRSVLSAVRGSTGGTGVLSDDCIAEIAEGLRDADVLGFSSMTGYAENTRRIISRVRQLSPQSTIIWGGIHPIIHPEDAILADVDAICTGEGEFAFEQVFDHLKRGTDPRGVRNFWFKDRANGEVVRNPFLPLMTTEEMETLPFPKYGDGEWIYREGKGFVPIGLQDFLATNGLGYTAIWSIGCPFHCSFCGNTKFIENDSQYKKIRHPSARYIVEEIKAVRANHPHISTVNFQDDSFMAIPLRELEEFAELWREEVGIPFAVYGVIPNYVRADKFEVLTWAGMNRIRMGIQSGSQDILDFYKRPTPIEKVEAAAEVISSFAPRYHIPPSYDVIVDNPIETREDVVQTLELFYRIARPFNLFIYSLKVIPNTDLAREMEERGVDLAQIDSSYFTIPPRWANLMLYVLTLWRPPRWVFDWMLKRVRASGEPQPMYPVLGAALRVLFFAKRVFDHLRFMDFSIIPGATGYVVWKIGVIDFWWKHFTPRPKKPEARGPRPLPVVAVSP